MLPANALVLPCLTALLVCQGCAGTTASNVSRVHESGSNAAIANLNLGAAYLRQGELALAVERLERALQHDARLVEAHSTIATVYDQLGAVEQAREHHREAIQLDPGDPAAANSYGVFLCRRQTWSEAEEQFLRAARNTRYPTPEVALTNAGICAGYAADGKQARLYFHEALSRNPAYPEGLYNMASLAFNDNDLSAARQYLDRSMESAPNDARVVRLCFQVETRLGNTEGARQCAAKMRELSPGSAEEVRQTQFQHGGKF